MILLLSGGRNVGILGPFVDRPQNDVGLIENWLRSSALPQPRALWMIGSGTVEADANVYHTNFMSAICGTVLRAPDYRAFSGNPATGTALTPAAPLCGGSNFGLVDTPEASSEVYNLDPLDVPEVQGSGLYDNVGGLGPYVASTYKPSVSARPWLTMIDGWDLKNLGTPDGDSSSGRLGYLWCAMRERLGSICDLTGPTPPYPLEVPKPAGHVIHEFLSIRNNPMLAGVATIDFALAHAERVEIAVYDLAGRRVRMLANREFFEGNNSMVWEGTNDQGQRVPRGLYAVRARSRSGRLVGSAKLILLR